MRNKGFALSKLPPTEAAASQHSLRVWAQVLKWNLKKIELQKFGWEMKNDAWYPVKLPKTQNLVPDDILKDLSCKCQTDCSKKTCGCVKHGLKCSEFCINCYEHNCKNTDEPRTDTVNINEIDDDTDEQPINMEAYKKNMNAFDEYVNKVNTLPNFNFSPLR